MPRAATHGGVLHPSLAEGTSPPDISKLDPVTLSIRNARALVRERREAEAKHRAAETIQRAWRGFTARSRLTLFPVGDRCVAADGAKILARGESAEINAAIRSGVAVDFAPMSPSAAEAFLSYLETGQLSVGAGLAAELEVAARRHDVPRLAVRAREILLHHADPATRVERWGRGVVGRTLVARSERELRARLGPLSAAGFERRFVETSVGRIHVLDKPGARGRRPIVVVHGVAASSLQMSAFLLELGKGASRVVAIDLLGHGESDIPNSRPLTGNDVMTGFRETARAVVDEPAFIYGNSFGGMNAVRYALDAPERVAGLVLASPAGAPLRLESRERLMDRFRIANYAQASSVAREMGLSGLTRMLAAFYMEARFAAPHLRQLVESADNSACFRKRELEVGLTMPLLLLFGRRDTLLDSEHRGFYMRHLPPHAVREEPEDLAHVPHLEAPARIAARVQSFIVDVEGRGPTASP